MRLDAWNNYDNVRTHMNKAFQKQEYHTDQNQRTRGNWSRRSVLFIVCAVLFLILFLAVYWLLRNAYWL